MSNCAFLRFKQFVIVFVMSLTIIVYFANSPQLVKHFQTHLFNDNQNELSRSHQARQYFRCKVGAEGECEAPMNAQNQRRTINQPIIQETQHKEGQDIPSDLEVLNSQNSQAISQDGQHLENAQEVHQHSQTIRSVQETAKGTQIHSAQTNQETVKHEQQVQAKKRNNQHKQQSQNEKDVPKKNAHEKQKKHEKYEKGDKKQRAQKKDKHQKRESKERLQKAQKPKKTIANHK